MKKNLFLVFSAMAMAASLNMSSFGACATLLEEHASGPLEDLVESFSSDVLVETLSNSQYGKSILAVTADRKASLFTESYINSEIVVKKGSTLPLDEIDSLLGKSSYLSQKDENVYSTYLLELDTRNQLNQILENYESVLSIDESYEVLKTQDGLWSVSAVIFDTDLSEADLISEFPELHLQVPKNPMEYDGVEGVVLELENPVGSQTITDEFYQGLKALQESGLSYSLGWEEGTNPSEEGESQVSKTNVYSVLQSGDLNLDGEVDISDAVLLMRVASEDSTVPVHSVGLSLADVDNDGTVTVNDTSRLLEQLVKLG